MDEQKKKELLGTAMDMKGALREIINKNATSFVKDDDAHTPIISVMQLSLAQASVEYLITCGVKPVEAVNAVCAATMEGMQKWIAVYTKQAEAKEGANGNKNPQHTGST